MKRWAMWVGVALMGVMAGAQAQSMYDTDGRYLGQANEVGGMTASQVVQYRDAQDYNAYANRAYTNEQNMINPAYNQYNQNDYRPEQGVVVKVPVIRIHEIEQVQSYSTPQMQCQWVNVPVQTGGSTSGTLLGSVIGGVLGHQIGRGRGRVAATVGGAVLGGGVGYAVSNATNYTSQRRCYETTASRYVRVPKYEVTYLYPLPVKASKGKKMHIDPASVHTVVLDHYPGRTMAVRLNTEVLN